jgi:TonB family protein
MGQLAKYYFVLSMLMICMKATGQNQDNEVLLDSVIFAEYIYLNMHYPLMDLINNVEGTAVYKFEIDRGIKTIKIVRSSGSSSLDREGIRLLWQVPKQGDEYPKHEILINFRLADNKIYETSELFGLGGEMPEFPGGNAEMAKFLSQNLHYPLEAAEMSIAGSIVCGFVVEKDGSINIVEVIRPLHHWFDAEAMRVIKRMPKWTAGKKDGKIVRVYFILPVKINL